MSWFSNSKESSGAGKQNFHPVTSSLTGYGPLAPKDTAWACDTHRGFQTETQIWYSILNDGTFLMVQVIWSYLGIMFIPATTQMTFKLYDPKTQKTVWKSVNASALKPDGQNAKTDQFEIKHTGTPETEEKYIISANLDSTVQISVTFTKPASAPGFKFGNGDKGGYSIFGTSTEDGKRDGFAIHRFHPFATSEGSVVINGSVVDVKGDAMFVHAIQGMKPDSLASRWNFGFFTSGGGKEESKLGSVRAVQMEFETTDSYGPQGSKSGRTKVNIGAIYTSASSNPLIVTGQTHHASPQAFPSTSNDVSVATHSGSVKDKDTGYEAPGQIQFQWASTKVSGKGQVSAEVSTPQGIVLGQGGLMEKVDVLAEIPYVIRKGLAAVTGTKPYIYQYLNPTTLNVKLDDEEIAVQGWLFNEATFVSQ